MYVSAICGWVLNVLLVCALFRFVLTFGSWLDMLLNSGCIVVLLVVRRRVFVAPKAVDVRRQRSAVLGNTSDYGERIEALLRPVMAAMGLADSEIEVVEDLADTTRPPSIGSADGRRHFLFLPLGFQRVAYEDPLQARAVLAHELAHVRQGDAMLWGRVTAFSSQVYILCAWLAFELLVSLVLLALASLVILCVSQGLVEGPPPASLDDALTEGIKGTLTNGLYLGAVLGMWVFVRAYRSRAEEMADGAAVLFGDSSGDGLRRGIIGCDADYARTVGARISTQTSRRLAGVDAFVRLASCPTEAEVLRAIVDAGTQSPGRDVRRRGAWLTGGGLAGVVSAWALLALMAHWRGLVVPVVFLVVFGVSAAFLLLGLAELIVANADPTRQSGQSGRR